MIFDPEGPSDTQGGIFGVNTTPQDAKVILIPVPFDATASYQRGAAKGPQAILQASDQLDLFDRQWGFIYKQGIALLPEDPTILQHNQIGELEMDDFRNHPQADNRDSLRQKVNAIGETINNYTYQQTKHYLENNKIVGILGGDHSCPFGAIKAYLERYPDLGILHIDAHADLRKAYEGFEWSHASIMYNVTHKLPLKHLVQIGIRDFSEGEFKITQNHPSITTFFDEDLRQQVFAGTPYQNVIDTIISKLPQHVYVSFDIDGLDPALCPHTGTPVPGGLQFGEVTALLRAIKTSGRKVVGFDLCEVAPGTDEWDGNVAARILYLLCGLVLP